MEDGGPIHTAHQFSIGELWWVSSSAFYFYFSDEVKRFVILFGGFIFVPTMCLLETLHMFLNNSANDCRSVIIKGKYLRTALNPDFTKTSLATRGEVIFFYLYVAQSNQALKKFCPK